MEKAPVLLSFIVPSLRWPKPGAGREHRLEDQLFEALAAQDQRVLAAADLANDRASFEVIWVCNGPAAQRSNEPIALHPQFGVLRQPEANANLARNQGAKVARGKWYYFIDDDLTFQNDGGPLELVDWLGSLPGELPVAFGAHYLNQPKGAWAKAYVESMQWLSDPIQVAKMGFLLGGSFGLSQRLFDQLGGFDPERAWGGCELGFNIRLRKWLCSTIEVGSADSESDTIEHHGTLRAGRILRLPERFDLIHPIRLSLIGLLKKAYKQGQGKRWAADRYGEGDVLELIPELNRATKPRYAVRLYEVAFRRGYLQQPLQLFQVLVEPVRETAAQIYQEWRRLVLKLLVQQLSQMQWHWRAIWYIARLTGGRSSADRLLASWEPGWSRFWRGFS